MGFRPRSLPALVRLIVCLLLGLPILVSSCGGAGSTSGSSATSSPSGYSIAILVGDKQTATLTVAELAKLPQVKQTVGNTEETGPTLLSALASVGVNDFTQLTVYGFSKGRVATAELDLTRAQVTDNVMLALVARGTAKLTGTDIGANRAIVDVNKIVVK